MLVHCFAGDVDSQFVATGFFDGLAQDHHVLGLDMRGHGRSGKPHDPRAMARSWPSTSCACSTTRASTAAHVIGYSMGAHLCRLQLLTIAPARLLTATLGGACGRRNWTALDDARIEREAAELEHGSLRAQTLRLWPCDRPLPSEAEMRARAARHLAGKDPLALAAVRRSNREQVVTDAQMAAVSVPTLGIVGSDDPYVDAVPDARDASCPRSSS